MLSFNDGGRKLVLSCTQRRPDNLKLNGFEKPKDANESSPNFVSNIKPI